MFLQIEMFLLKEKKCVILYFIALLIWNSSHTQKKKTPWILILDYETLKIDEIGQLFWNYSISQNVVDVKKKLWDYSQIWTVNSLWLFSCTPMLHRFCFWAILLHLRWAIYCRLLPHSALHSAIVTEWCWEGTTFLILFLLVFFFFFALSNLFVIGN